jgi:hypothetical protein
MLQQFFNDLSLPDCVIQLGPLNAVTKMISGSESGEIDKFLQQFASSNNLFFLAGVRASPRKLTRAKDEDIFRKNYFYLDFDIRKSQPDITDSEIKNTVWASYLKPLLTEMGAPFSDWRYVVFTGNGLHVYYFGEPVVVANLPKGVWAAGVKGFLQLVEKEVGQEIDPACVNPARVARVPGSQNMKSAPPKLAEIIDYQDMRIDLSVILKQGMEMKQEVEETRQKQAQQIQASVPLHGEDTYSAIQKIPAGEILCLLTGWTMMDDKKNFQDAGGDRKGCCLAGDGNYIVHTGTPHLPPDKSGYRPFELVKAYKKYDNKQVFMWFKDRFPKLRELSAKEYKKPTAIAQNIDNEPLPDRPSPQTLYEKMLKEPSRVMKMSDEMDQYKFVNRGKVTRIGALWGTGKSKLAYFFVHMLLKRGYKGIIFSTEVTAEEVMSNLYCIPLQVEPSAIESGDATVPPGLFASYDNLAVYDVTHTKNLLSRIEGIIKREFDRHEAGLAPKLDFIVIDYAGMIASKSAGFMKEVFTWATRYGSELQEIANTYDLAILDIFQLGKEGMTDLNGDEHGYIPFVGGPALNASADVAVIVKRDKSSANNYCTVEIRKSKPLHGKKVSLQMEYNWRNSTFQIAKGGDLDATMRQFPTD